MLKWLDSSVSLARFLLDSTYLAKADKFIYVGFDEKKNVNNNSIQSWALA